MMLDELVFLHSWHDIERAIDGERYDGQLKFVGQSESSSAEHSHVPREGACSLGEYHERCSALQCGFGAAVCGTYLSCTSLIDVDVAGVAASCAEERDLLQRAFHHPSNLDPKVTADEEDVIRPLMVGDENVRLSGTDVLSTFYRYGQ